MSEASVNGFSIGSRAEFEHVITAQDIQRFVDMTGDDNPLHVDSAFAEKTSFKGIVAHGMLSASFISTLIGKKLPGSGALWMSQSLEFLLPVRTGDRLTIRAEVTGVQVAQRILALQTDITNQHGQRVLTGESRVKVLEVRSAPAPDPREGIKPVAIVTGASRGIGAATAARLADDGFSVVINYRHDEAGARRVAEEIVRNKGEATIFCADVSDRAQVRAMIAATLERFGSLSALVNNASAQLVTKPFAALLEEDLASQMRVQFYGAFYLIQEALPFLEKSSNAAVVNIGTINSDGAPATQLLSYTAAKAALVSLTKSLAVEYGPRGIRFNLVAPGMTDTRMIADLPERGKMLARMQAPLRRLSDPTDIADAVSFLLDPRSRHITGETLRVCGGTVML
jgi:3-oxoacyl-[acyl-carrier protein] reductase